MSAAPGSEVWLTWLAAGYLLGSIPTSYLAGRALFGIDLREHGSGNLGATNALRVLGVGPGICVLAIDALKGWVAVALAASYTGRPTDALLPLAAGTAAVLGHVFPAWLGFKGGKGVATAAGVFAAAAPKALLVCLAVFTAVVYATRYVSAGSLAAALALPFSIHAWGYSPACVKLGATVAVLVTVTHRANIQRLLKGEENRLGSAGRSARSEQAGSDGGTLDGQGR